MYARKVQNRDHKSRVCSLKTQLETQHDHMSGGGATDISFDDVNHFCLNFESLSFQLVASGGLGLVTSMKGRTQAA